MQKLATITLLIGTTVCLTSPALAVKAHVQKISKITAETMCKSHGGGTDCSYKDGDHIHLVSCDKRGKCFNTVNPARTLPSGTSGSGKAPDARTGGGPTR